MEGLVGIGGKEKHAPIRVLSRGMWDEFDVLHDVEDISDSDIVGGRGPILDDARDARDARVSAPSFRSRGQPRASASPLPP